MNKNILNDFLNQLGLSKDQSNVFTSLLEKGTQTVLELSRNSGINRTNLYRILDDMKKFRIIDELVDENKRLYRCADLHQLELIIKEHELKALALKEAFPNISEIISANKETAQPGTRVIFHRGVEGIKQMVWNTLQTRKEVVGYTYRRLDEIVGEKFSQDWHNEWVARKLKFRDIYSSEYLKSIKQDKGINYFSPTGYFESRYLSAKVLNVNHQVDIYNNVVAYYNWYESEVFGVEIYNQKISDLQKQLFEIVWQVAKPLPKNLRP